MDSKLCKKCATIKPISEFYKKKFSKDGFTIECKTCWLIETKKYRDNNPDKIKSANKEQYQKNRDERILKQKEWADKNKYKIIFAKKARLEKDPEYNRRWLLKKYGLSKSDFTKMLIGQNNSCWICETIFKKVSDAKIDHCHNSNIVRGLLCSNCNTALGLVKEKISTLKIMIEYLKNNKDGWKEF